MSAAPPNPPPEVIAQTFGPFVTGIMLQQLLMGVIVVQVYDYYRVFTRDAVFYKCLVGLLFVITILQCTMDYKNLYRAAVEYYGNFDKFDDTDWTLWWEIAVTAIIGSISQTFFLERCFQATKSWFVLILGGLGILTSLAAGIASTIEFMGVKRLSLAPSFAGPVLTWLISAVVIDVSIASLLVWSITRVRSRFRKTETIVGKIIRISFTTSALTATIAIVNLILYMALPGQAYHLLPQLIMGKIYVISCMVTLSSRSELREILEQSGNSTYQETRLETRRKGTTSEMGLNKSEFDPTRSIPAPGHKGLGIHISTTTHIKDDNDNDIDVPDTDSKKNWKGSAYELGPVSRGDGKDMEIPIQYPDGRIVGGKKADEDSTSDDDGAPEYTVSKLGGAYAV